MTTENIIIRDSFKNIQENLDKLKIIIKENKDYKNAYKLLLEQFKDLIGKQMWITNKNNKFEMEVIDEILDLDSNIKKVLKNIEGNK